MELRIPGTVEVSSVEFERHVARYQELALTQDVAVTRDGGASTVLISSTEYRRLKGRDRRVMELGGFTAADIAALEAARAPDAAKVFDDELLP